MSNILENKVKFRLKLNTIFRYCILVYCLIWPWQTRYFLSLGANEYLTSSIYLSDLVVLALFLLVILRSKADLKAKELLKYFFIGLVPVAILAIAQFSLQTTWPTKWLGLAQHDSAQLGQVVIETANGERWLRAYGSYDHPNILGGVMAMALLLLLINTSKQWGALESIYTVLFSSALFFSFSRAAWLGLAVGLVVYLGISLYKKEKVQKSFFVILLVLYSLFSILYLGLVFARVAAEGRIEQKSIYERVNYYGEAKELFLQHPFFGVGFRNYVPSLMELKPGRPAWSYQPVHNSFILGLVELGLIGVILLIGVMWLVFRYKIKDIRYKMNAEIFTLLSLIFTLAMLDHWLWSLHAGWLFIGLMAVISVKLLQEE